MLLENTNKLLTEMSREKVFDSYAVIVGAGGEEKTLFSENVNEETYFDIASMGKVLVTSSIILHAIGDGKLALSDTLDMFFENVPDEKKKITVKQLLTHSSGIVRHPITSEAVKKGHDGIASEILSFPLAFEPGKGEIYSCNGFILLGYIAEKIYGMPLSEIFEKAEKPIFGFERSRFKIATDEPNAAVSYRRENVGENRFDDENIYTMGESAGSGAQFFTPADMRRFVLTVLRRDEKLYPREIFDEAEKAQISLGDETRGLGYCIVDKRYRQTGKLFPVGSFGHCGHTGCSFFISRKLGIYVIILSNATRFLNMRSGFRGYDYGEIMKLREKIHNEIYKDLTFEEMLKEQE